MAGDVIDRADLRRLEHTLGIYAKATGKDLAEVANRFMRQATIFLTAKIPRVDPGRIESDLRRVVATITTKKGKQRVIRRASPLAHAIIRARAARAGEESLSQREVETRARRMVAGRKRAVGFVRAGNATALRAFGGRVAGARQLGKPKGTAQVATPRRIEAKLTNQVQGRRGGLAVKIAARFVGPALREVEADMRRYAEGKLAKRAKAAERR